MQKDVLPWMANTAGEALRLFKPMPATAVSSEPIGRMALGAPVPTSVYVQQDVPPITLTKTPPVVAAIDVNASEAKPSVTVPPKGKRHAISHGRDRSDSRSRRLAAAEPMQSTRKPQHVRTGTPRYNLLLSLGGAY